MKKKLYPMTDEEKKLMETFQREVGVRMGRLRRKLGITQVKMADIIGTSSSSYQKYEEGSREIPVEKLIILCKNYALFSDDELEGVNEEIIPLFGKKTEEEQKVAKQITNYCNRGRKMFDNIEESIK